MDYRGGIGFAHSNGVYGNAIRLAERLRHPVKGAGQWNHVFCSLGNGAVIEARAGGVRVTPLSVVMARGPVQIHPCPGDPEKFVEFHVKAVGKEYGWGTIASQVVDIVTPNWFPSFRVSGTWDCSGLAAAALWYSGAYFDFADVYLERPSDIAGVICHE